MVEGAVGSDFDAVGAGGGEFVEFADDKGEEVGGHFGCGFKKCCIFYNVFDGHVADDGVCRVGGGDGEGEGGFGGGFVDAGEALAGVVGFKLGSDDRVFFACVAVGGEVGAGHVGADGEGVGDGEADFAGFDGGEGDGVGGLGEIDFLLGGIGR